jgi:Fur family transcriptional regulator, ferric uptake regulator
MIDQLLLQKGLRITNFRKQVLDIFLKQDKSLAVSEIEQDLREFDRITLYRTIKTFIDKGLIHEIVMPGDIKKLALCSHSCDDHDGHHHEHVHFQCKHCNDVLCVDIANFPQLDVPGFQIDSIEIQLVGVCANCKSI